MRRRISAIDDIHQVITTKYRNDLGFPHKIIVMTENSMDLMREMNWCIRSHGRSKNSCHIIK
jgi:hypothetical protein